MSLRFLLTLVCTLGVCLLGSCASLPGPDLPTCDGRSRRPANPHGSVLSPAPAPPAATAPATVPEVMDAGVPPRTGGCA